MTGRAVPAVYDFLNPLALNFRISPWRLQDHCEWPFAIITGACNVNLRKTRAAEIEFGNYAGRASRCAGSALSAVLEIGVSGIGAFLPAAPDWISLRGILRGQRRFVSALPATPPAAVLPLAQRRRAPDGARIAVEVAEQACRMARIEPAGLPCVFASTYGEIPIIDYLCKTLAHAPKDVSLSRFQNSVLNAAIGYWTIATGATGASSPVTAGDCSFAAGLLQAPCLACSDAVPVLFVSWNVASTGPLVELTCSRAPFSTMHMLPWTLVLFVLTAILLLVALWRLRGNPWYALAAIWGLVGAYIEQRSAPLDGAQVASGIALALAIIVALFATG